MSAYQITRSSGERRQARTSVRLPVRVQRFEVVDGQLVVGPIVRGEARDLALGGLFIGGRGVVDEAAPGRKVHFYLDLPDGGGCLEGFGEVVHDQALQPVTGDPVVGRGIRITHLGAAERARLAHFVDERLEIGHVARRAAEARLRAEKTLLG